MLLYKELSLLLVLVTGAVGYKNVKGASSKNQGRVARDVMENLRQTKKENGAGNAPLILTSSETKLGRDDVWGYLSLAAEL